VNGNIYVEYRLGSQELVMVESEGDYPECKPSMNHMQRINMCEAARNVLLGLESWLSRNPRGDYLECNPLVMETQFSAIYILE
jgi:hypothetical protein